MKFLSAFLIGLLLLCCFSGNIYAQKKTGKQKNHEPLKMEHSPELQALLDKAVSETISGFLPKVVKNENVAATLIDLRDPQNLRTAHYNGDVRLYTASVVKMFYMAALHRWLEDGKVKLTPELERGLKDMIVDSSNDATHYILDVLTDAPNGNELSPKELEKFAYKRNAVNRYFQSLGYENINVNQKTYCEDIYGRERQFWDKGKYRNMLTTNATARLLAEIALGKSVTPERSQKMLDLMKRDFTGEAKDPDNQAHGFTGIALNNLKMTDAKLWSKAGWTSKSRHDAAYIETPDGLKFVLVVFTENNSNERGIIPGIAEKVINGLK
ncbi:MAG TPA: serine hydrolase [Pyrinomonadaceae bacterium]|nr:serine hydrolase [Pyrinomonadaceae bacterium]